MRNLPRHLAEGGTVQAGLIRAHQRAARRSLLLDYDGTLVPFKRDPMLARPDSELLDLLAKLGTTAGNEVAIVSGRARRDLEEWFGQLPVALAAEHGVWLRPRRGEWRMLKALTTEWKPHVRPVLQVFVDRLPGAWLEEKEFALAWHYRRADPEQALPTSRELLGALAGFTRSLGVQVLEGNKVLEVRNAGISKGAAAKEWLGAMRAEFVLAIGDDRTDEDLFRALPATAWSVRVGPGQTAARYYLNSHMAVRRLLWALVPQPPVAERARAWAEDIRAGAGRRKQGRGKGTDPAAVPGKGQAIKGG